MDTETFIVLMAHNGLSTAVSMLATAAAKLERKAGQPGYAATADLLRSQAASKVKLAKVLAAADAGVADYLAHI